MIWFEVVTCTYTTTEFCSSFLQCEFLAVIQSSMPAILPNFCSLSYVLMWHMDICHPSFLLTIMLVFDAGKTAPLYEREHSLQELKVKELKVFVTAWFYYLKVHSL